MNNINQLKESQKDKHPGFNNYIECCTRGLFTGLATFSLGFAGLYFGQKVLQNHLPIDKKFRILICTAVATVASYQVTATRIKSCQAGWLAFEEKHTALTES